MPQQSRADALVPAVQRVAIVADSEIALLPKFVENCSLCGARWIGFDPCAKCRLSRPAARSDERQPEPTVLREAIAERAEWDDPSDTNTRSKTPRQVIGYRRADPLLILHKRGGEVTKDHIRAAHRFRDDYEIGHGARPGYDRMNAAAGSSDDKERPGAAEMQFRAMDGYKAAMLAVGIRLSSILVVVVLEGRSPTSYAEEKGQSAVKMVGYLVAALDRLQEHYEQGPRAGRV